MDETEVDCGALLQQILEEQKKTTQAIKDLVEAIMGA